MAASTPLARPLVAGALLVLIVVAAYAPAWSAGFVWDDDLQVTRNALVQSPGGLRDIWTARERLDYFPLTSTLFWLQWRLFGGEPAGYHVVDVLLHAGAALLLWRVLRRLALPGAWLGALLFAVHPVAVASVAWITETKNTLALLCGAASALLWLRWLDGAGRRAWAAALLAFVLSLLAKPALVLLPALLLLCTWWRRGVVRRREWQASVPFFAAALVLGWVTLGLQDRLLAPDSAAGGGATRVGATQGGAEHGGLTIHGVPGADVGSESLLQRAALAGRGLLFYVRQALWPVRLTVIYPRWDAPTEPGELLAALLPAALVVAVLAAALRWRAGRGRPLLFGLGAYLLLLLPVLGLLPMTYAQISRVSDHLAYAALVAPAAAVGAALGRLRPALAAAPAAMLVLALAAASHERCRLYASPETLFRHNVQVEPEAGPARAQLALALLARGDPAALAEAETHLREAVRRLPRVAALHGLLGALAGNAGRDDEARAEFEAALALDPDDADARHNLGRLQLLHGELPQAAANLRRAAELRPEDAQIARDVERALAGLRGGEGRER